MGRVSDNLHCAKHGFMQYSSSRPIWDTFAVSAFSLVDFYRTGTVDSNDVIYFAAACIQYQQTGVLNPACDLNHDSKLDFNDILLFVSDYQAAAQSKG